MTNYRIIKTTFWSDTKIFESYTPEDRYFYLYLMTNPHTNLCGCYEIGKRQMALETGYSDNMINKLLDKFMNQHNVIRYSEETKEILLVNWHKHNWTASAKYIAGVKRDIETVKDEQFKTFLTELANGKDTVSIPYSDKKYPIESTISNTKSNTNSNAETIPPTLEMVQEYIDKNNYGVNAQEFIDFYNSKGWMVGKNKMKSWTSALGGWESRRKKEEHNGKKKGWLFDE